MRSPRPGPGLLLMLLVGGCGGSQSAVEGAEDTGAPPAGPPPAVDSSIARPYEAGGAEQGAGSSAASCHAPAVSAPSWQDLAIGYEIFVRSFQDSDGDGVGDLPGLISRLDHLSDGDPDSELDLGVDLLWLMPIQPSPSYHGYDVTDYRGVDSEYGSLADLELLVQEAEARGIRVILDLVLNHSSTLHPWFQQGRRSQDAPTHDYYVWSDSFLDWDRPWGPGPTWHPFGDAWYYALFWEGMPDLNFQHPALRQEMLQTALYWLDKGVAGFRLDAARYLVETGPGEGQADTPETHQFWRDLREAADTQHPGSMLLGEIWTDSSIVATYFGTEAEAELTMSFDFDLAQGLVQAIQQGSAAAARIPLCGRLGGWPPLARAGTFATNHDMARLATRLAGAGEPGLRLAAALVLTLPGTPWLYYGQEIGMRSGSVGGDEAHRLPMQWTEGAAAGFSTGPPWREPESTTLEGSVAGQTSDAGSLLSLHRRLIRLRRATPALHRGATQRLETAGPTLALEREAGGERVVLLFHFDKTPGLVSLDAAGARPAGAWEDLLSGEAFGADVDMGPLGFRILAPSG